MNCQKTAVLITISGPCPAPINGRILIGPMTIIVPDHLLALCQNGCLGIHASLAANTIIATAVIPAAQAPQQNQLGFAEPNTTHTPPTSRPTFPAQTQRPTPLRQVPTKRPIEQRKIDPNARRLPDGLWEDEDVPF